MTAAVACPQCGHRCRPPLVEAAEGQARCPACLNLFPIAPAPAASMLARSGARAAAAPLEAGANRTVLAQPESMIRYTCPRCKKSLESPASFAGRKLNCPDCNQRLQIPRPSAPAAPPINKTVLAQEQASPAPPPSVRNHPADEPLLDLVEAEEPAPRERCLECGANLARQSRVQTCPDCGSLFCSARCIREHHYYAHAPRRRERPRAGECRYCGCPEPPYYRTQISDAGWVTFAILLVLFFPLCWIGLLITETRAICADCGRRLYYY